MAGLAETEEFPEEVYQIETTDPVVGGAPNEGTGAGMSNIPHLQLAKRTRWLKAQVDTLVAAVVQATTGVAGIVQLSTSTNSTSITTAATPSAVKAANDNANTRALKATTIMAAGLATGGGDLSANRTITVPKASQAEAEAGADDTKAMTPLTTRQALDAAGAPFEATGLAMSQGGIIHTLAHGLGVVPARLQLLLTCQTAENGFEVGDVVDLSSSLIHTTATSNSGLISLVSNTQIRIVSSNTSFQLYNRSTGASFSITNASWTLTVRAWPR